MLISNKFNGYVAGRRTYHTGMEPILLGAAMGGISSAAKGGNPLQGALLGGVTGGVGGALAGTVPSFLGSAASAAPITALTAPAATAATTAAAAPVEAAIGAQSFALPTPDIATAALPPIPPGSSAGIGDWLGAYEDLAPGLAPSGSEIAAASPSVAPASSGLSFMNDNVASYNVPSKFNAPPAPSKGLMETWKSLPLEKKILYGGGAMGLMSLLSQPKGNAPKQTPYDGPLSRFKYNPSTYRPAFPNGMARGGIASLGSYSDGGRLLKGPGDGMSDHIPATIARKQPARLADGEFVVPADVVSHLGNGSTDAGAKQLYAMMKRVRTARTGREAQGKKINAKKLIPA